MQATTKYHFKALSPTFIFSLFVAILLSSCGGDSGSDSGSSGKIPDLNSNMVLASGEEGEIGFNSLSPGNISQFITGIYDKTTTTVISGILALPPNRTGKVPAMIILHSSAGILDNLYDYWTPQLTSNGIAAYVIDSYTARNPPQVPSGQRDISHAVQMVDAMVALKFLSKHPDIDPDRIGVMGFSSGAMATQALIFDESRKDFFDETMKFAAYIEFYPACERRQWSINMASEPILTLLGELDQNGTANACVELNGILSNNGANITTTVYPGVYHGFDSVGFYTLNDLLVFTTCSSEFRLDTLVKRNYKTNKIHADFREHFAELVQCASETIPNTITLGGTQASIDNSTTDVISFLNTAFTMP